jgi:hypothetical protein
MVMMGVAGVTTLHTIGVGKLELFPLHEAKSSSLATSLRMSCSDGDLLRAMPPTTALELSLRAIDANC